MLEKNYLYFRRVDTYADDKSDGEQLPLDRKIHETIGFIKDPTYTTDKYYDSARSRSYASCLSLENSDYIWKNYGNSGKDAICLEVEFGKLRRELNDTLLNMPWYYGPYPIKSIFSINYGIAEYVDWHNSQNSFRNPIKYLYMKNKEKYQEEKELRVSLSAMGTVKFVLSDSTEIEFPEFINFPFNFKKAFGEDIIKRILKTPACDRALLTTLADKITKLGFKVCLED